MATANYARADLEDILAAMELRLASRIDGLAIKVDSLDAKIDGVRTDLTTKIDGVRTDLTTKYNDLFAKIDGLGQELTQVRVRTNQIYDALEKHGLPLTAKDRRGMMARPKKPRGRPVKYPMPERIDASPEEIADVVLRAKPKQVWKYEEEAGRNRRRADGE